MEINIADHYANANHFYKLALSTISNNISHNKAMFDVCEEIWTDLTIYK